MHRYTLELRLGCNESIRGLPRAYQFTGEDSGFLCGLFGLGGVAFCPSASLDYEGFGFILDDFQTCDVAVELACILAD